jgi:hypothetical protein
VLDSNLCSSVDTDSGGKVAISILGLTYCSRIYNGKLVFAVTDGP